MGILALTGGTPVRTRPFPTWPVWGDVERQQLAQVLESGNWWYGEKVKAFEAEYAAFHGAKYGVSCMNGSMALEMGLWACGIQAGDEVIVPPYTFIATPISVLRMNAVPVFADVDLATCNLDLAAVEAAITPRTKAILPVHFGGVPVDMDALNALADRHGLRIIEDACHSWGSQWKGKGTGALGDCGAFSFQVSKNITAGEGGILLTDDEEIANRARAMSNYGRGLGGVWYRHYIPGTNLRMTEMQAAVLLGQLSRLEEQTLTRQHNAARLDAAFRHIPGLAVQACDPRVTRRGVHLYILRFLAEHWDGVSRDRFLNAMEAEGVPCWGGYPISLHRQPVFTGEQDDLAGFPAERRPYAAQGVEYSHVACPNTDLLCTQAVWLSQPYLLGSVKDMQDIIDAVTKIWEHRHELAALPV